jgi:hypothetical protein
MMVVNETMNPTVRLAVSFTFIALLLSPLLAHSAVFVVTNNSATGPGSLGQAITDSNATPGADEIRFAIPGAGVQTIDVSRTQLPEVTDQVTIDGYTQPGAKPNSREIGNDAIILIQIYGRSASATAERGLLIKSNDCVVRGLSFGGFEDVYDSVGGPLVRRGYGIVLQGSRDIVAGNFIGVAPDGQTRTFNGVGVFAALTGAVIGGISPAARNVISFNQVGVLIDKYVGNIVLGNYIGTDASGMEEVGNGTGIEVIYNSDTRIGGIDHGAGNVIAGNEINISVAGDHSVIQGNLIGLSADGLKRLRVLSQGIINGQSNAALFFAKIGGLEPGAANRIAGLPGIQITSGWGNTILSNEFFDYGGITLGEGRTRNDLGDRDDGPNRRQNFPVITEITRGGSTTNIKGGLNSLPSKIFVIQFFAIGDFSGQPSPLIGTETVTTDGAGIASFEFTYPIVLDGDGSISATATETGEGDTSEFSPPFSSLVQIANVSSRGFVGAGDDVLIGGFVIHQPVDPTGVEFRKRVLIRALGPSLTVDRVPVPDRLADPRFDVYDSNGQLIASNDNWKSSQQAEIEATGAAPSRDLEAAAILSLPKGGYTVQVRGVDNATGVGLVEVYDLHPLDGPPAFDSGRLVNISTRARVGTGADLLIGGFIVNGDTAQSVLARAIGPDLTAIGVPGALQDPTLELRDASGTVLAFNDDWREAQESEIITTGIPPQDSRDSAIKVNLIPGNYTAIVRGKGDTKGIALVELFDLLR